MLLLLDARLRVVLDGELARVRLDDVLVAGGGLGALAQPHLGATGRVHRGQRHLATRLSPRLCHHEPRLRPW